MAHVSDGFADQENIVRVNGKRATYLAILKNADASTLAVVDAVKRRAARASKPWRREGLELKIDFDQSVFVRAAINGRAARGGVCLGPGLADDPAVFLGSWRSVVIVCTSIPLAIFAAHHRPQPHRQQPSTS